MAIDSEQKRKSVATVGPPINAPSVVPDGSLTNPDRQQIAWSYSGIQAGGAPSFIVAWALPVNHLLDGGHSHVL